MLNALAAGLSALALTAAAPALAPAADEIPASLDWRVQPAGSAAAPGTVEFDLGYHSEHHNSMMGGDVALSALDGLTAAALAAEGRPVSFAIHRDAGEFQCKGVMGQGRGVGTCVFAAKATFAPALAKRGIGAPNASQQFQLALTDIGLDYVDELKRENYATPSLDDLVRAGTHGAGMRQLKAMDAAGYRFGSVAMLVHARDHGVSARYIEALKGYGYKGLPAEQLVRMRDHGVSTTYIAELQTHGYSGLAAEDLVKMRDHGISTGFVRSANRDGKHLPPDELIRRREGGERD